MYHDIHVVPVPKSNIADYRKDAVRFLEVGRTHGALSVIEVEADDAPVGPIDGQAISLSLAVATEADRVFNALAADGKVEMPMGPSFFARRFGAVADKFGIDWMIMVPQAA